MKRNKNIIRKQELLFQYNGKADGFALQKEVSDWCTQTLVPELERQLDAFDLGDEIITIDKLEIGATLERSDWQQKIKTDLMTSLKNNLLRQKAAVRKENKVDAPAQKIDDLIVYYFEHGHLPWWSSIMVDDGFEKLMKNWINEPKDENRKEGIRRQLVKIISAAVAERVVNQVPVQQFFKFLRNNLSVQPGMLNYFEDFFKVLFATGSAAQDEKKILQQTCRLVLVLALQDKLGEQYDAVLSDLYAGLRKTGRQSVLPETDSLDKIAVENPLPGSWKKILKENLHTERLADEGSEEKAVQLSYNKMIDEMKGSEQADEIPDQSVLAEGIYIENAGAVIIAAFLPTLFSKLDLTNDNEISEPALAAMLIQYAVSGTTDSREHELVLPKIFCGLDLELPLDTDIKITTDQQSEVDEMLSSVVEHWAALGNTSLEGLRSSFLMRNGKLTFVNNEWLLQVEQKAYDVLLQQLPWNISMIKLPWMSHLLKTEWV